MRKAYPASFPLDLLVRRPDEMAERYPGGDPIIRYPGFETTAEDAAELIHLAGRMRAALLALLTLQG